MNDDELDVLLREAPVPKSAQPLKKAHGRASVWELVLFALVTVAVLAWASASLSRIFGG